MILPFMSMSLSGRCLLHNCRLPEPRITAEVALRVQVEQLDLEAICMVFIPSFLSDVIVDGKKYRLL